MSKEFWYTLGGTLLGSLVEEGVEHFFPGVGELGILGEATGAIAGLLSANSEAGNAVESFIRFAYRNINDRSAPENVSDDELRIFSEQFGKLPAREKQRIINAYKGIAPHEYEFLYDFLSGLKGV